ncbi:hypothetical protein MMC09_001057 [Bachmanniomyces sp. S44760]|nr:hypothetical protein [Bachmanniomyces sp. S44760]
MADSMLWGAMARLILISVGSYRPVFGSADGCQCGYLLTQLPFQQRMESIVDIRGIIASGDLSLGDVDYMPCGISAKLWLEADLGIILILTVPKPSPKQIPLHAIYAQITPEIRIRVSNGHGKM